MRRRETLISLGLITFALSHATAYAENAGAHFVGFGIAEFRVVKSGVSLVRWIPACAEMTYGSNARTTYGISAEMEIGHPGQVEIALATPKIRLTGLPRHTVALADASPSSSPATTQASSLREDPRYLRWRTALTWGLVILITFVTAAAAIIVFSRRFRRWIGREKKVPTPNDDVWAMHKVPEDEPHDLN